MGQIINIQYVINSIVFSGIGILVLLLAFLIVHVLTPYRLWKEVVENKNVALAILLGAFAISIGLIISSAIHG